MVRTYLLGDEERREMKEYLHNPPTVMSGRLRQARLKAKGIDFDRLRDDVNLIERFMNLKIPKGRVSKGMKAGFIIAQTEKKVKADFEIGGSKTPEKEK